MESEDIYTTGIGFHIHQKYVILRNPFLSSETYKSAKSLDKVSNSLSGIKQEILWSTLMESRKIMYRLHFGSRSSPNNFLKVNKA